MSTRFYTDARPGAQENGHQTGLMADSPVDLPVPFEIECRFATRRDLYRWQDMNARREADCQRVGDDAGAERAARRWHLIQDELDRRDAIAAEKERRREARKQIAAAAFRAGMGIRS